MRRRAAAFPIFHLDARGVIRKVRRRPLVDFSHRRQISAILRFSLSDSVPQAEIEISSFGPPLMQIELQPRTKMIIYDPF
jgi:hypothetical protein